MRAVSYDTNYLVKLQLSEPGSDEVHAHAQTVGTVHSSLHGRAEFVTAMHRKLREGQITRAIFHLLIDQLHADAQAGGLIWIPIAEGVVDRIEAVIRDAPADTFLRAADALHLSAAAAGGFTEIFSSDKHLLRAASLFGLEGRNVIR